MARGEPAYYTFNRGVISRLALARTDLTRIQISAEQQTNWVPRTLGSMMLRPGWEYIETTRNAANGRLVDWIYTSTDTAIVEVTDKKIRVLVADSLITRAGSTAAITGGQFTSTALVGWTDADESNSTSMWFSGNYMGLQGTRYNRAIRRQLVSASSGAHGLAIEVERGEPILKVGSSAGGDDYIEEVQLRPGNYSFEITSTGNFNIEFSANTEYSSLVKSVAIESSGPMALDSTWVSTDLGLLRWKQSGDVLFVGAYGYPQKRIERIGGADNPNSWSVVDYVTNDGPFRNINTSFKQLTPSAKTGNITLTADKSVFKSGNVGSLYQITSVGQEVEITITDGDQWSDSIRVNGVEDTRKFQYLISSHGSTLNTVRIQQSVGEEGSWTNVTNLAFTSTVDSTHDDGLDNQIVFYRVGAGSTDWGSTTNTAAASLIYGAGGITGTARVVDVVNDLTSSAIVLDAFGSTSASELWSEGDWSTRRGFPSAVTIHEGRMVWAGKSKLWLSAADAYESFDPDIEGDSAPVNRSIGSGPVDVVEWLASLTRLMIGSQGAEIQIKTTSLEEPISPTNFAPRDIETEGSASVQAAKVGKRAYFVQQGGTRVFEIVVSNTSLDYEVIDRTIAVPEIGEPSIVRMAVQRQPDTRLHCVRSDGTVAMLVADPAENVLAWINVVTDGSVTDVAVLPGDIEDQVYYLVSREINGSTSHYIEKWAQESEARGGSLNKMADSFVTQESTSTTVVSGLGHLVGESVVVWGATADLGTYTVSTTGTVTASQASTAFVAGLGYDGWFKSAKLAFVADPGGTALTARKKIDHLGVIVADMHARGLEFGPSTTNVDPMPSVVFGATISTDYIWTDMESDPIPFPGSWDTDSRLVLHAQAPRPATVLGAVIQMETKR